MVDVGAAAGANGHQGAFAFRSGLTDDFAFAFAFLRSAYWSGLDYHFWLAFLTGANEVDIFAFRVVNGILEARIVT